MMVMYGLEERMCYGRRTVNKTAWTDGNTARTDGKYCTGGQLQDRSADGRWIRHIIPM
jgi:hypothetical protein